MTAPLHDSLLRFWRETHGSRSVVGTGFLADGADGRTYALTCAHVANLAMGRGLMDRDRAESGTITADLVGRGTTVTLDLVGWHPPVAVQAARGSDVADIAIFRPRSPFTPPFRPALRIEPPGRIVPPGQRVAFHSFGFMGAQDGVATHGFLTATDAGGWFVADGDAAFRRFIDEGLSGAPVFANGRVLGMVVQRLERDAKQGLVIPALSIARAWPPLASPYPGLPAFDADTAHLFFGRGRPTTPGAAPTGRLLDVLDRLRSQRLVALMGASGSGKSSLAKAGVADAYRQDGWTVLTFRPGLAPLRNLAEAIATAVEGLGPGPQRLMAMDRWEQALVAGRLGEAVATAQGQGAAGVLIVVDQFEEFFTGQDAGDAEAAEMARQRGVILPQIRGVVERGAAHALLTARLDLIESMVTGDSEAARLLSDPYPIFVLTGIAARDVREAIEGPAALFGVGTDPGFATNLAAAATREDGRLPLLQEALRQCWAGLEPPHSQGGPDGWCLRPPTGGGEDDGSADRLLEEALARRGAEALAGMRFDVVDVQRVLLSLVRLADGRATRRIVPLAEVGAEDRPILDRLADERLVILDGERGTAEIVHEALMVRWPQLAGWIDGQRSFLEWRERFEREFHAWEAGGREAKDVLRPHDLARALDWMQTPDRAYGRPTGKQGAFIRRSDAVARADAARRRRMRHSLFAALLAALIILTIGAGTSFYLYQQQRQATARAEAALAAATHTANGLVFDLVQKFKRYGLHNAMAREILQRASDLQDRLAQGNEDNSNLLHSRAAMLDERARSLADFGDPGGAAKAAEESLGIFRILAQREPDNSQFQRDLAVSLNRVADIRGRSDPAAALALYDEGLGIARTLAQREPDNSQFQRDLAVILNKIADIRRRSDPAAALALYDESLGIARTLAQREPDNSQFQRNLAVSLDRVADIRGRSDPAAALALSEESLGIARTLAQREPDNSQFQRDLSVSLNRVADIRRRSDPAAALALYDESLGIARTLAQREPDNSQFQRDLSVSLNRVADIRGRSDPAAALALTDESLGIARTLAQREPDNSQFQTDLVVSLVRTAQAGVRAEAHLSEALSILTGLNARGQLSSDQQGWIGAVQDALHELSAPDASPATAAKKSNSP